MSKQMVTIEITRKAADCLSWFLKHDAYGSTLSEVIVDHVTEWAAREGKTLDQLEIDGEFEKHFKDGTNKQKVGPFFPWLEGVDMDEHAFEGGIGSTAPDTGNVTSENVAKAQESVEVFLFNSRRGGKWMLQLFRLVEQCIQDQRNGNDVLASAAWDRVTEHWAKKFPTRESRMKELGDKIAFEIPGLTIDEQRELYVLAGGEDYRNKPKRCPACGGEGTVLELTCGVTGTSERFVCPSCRGEGYK